MLLEQKNIDLSILDSKGIPLMRYLMRFYNEDIWSAFMDGLITKIDVNARHPDGYTTLYYALCYAGDPEQAPMEAVLKLLDHKDIDVNVVADNFATPLVALLFNKNFNEGLCLKLLNHKKLKKLTADYTTELDLFAYVVGNTEGRNLLNEKEPPSSKQSLRLGELNRFHRLRLWHAWSTFRQKIASATESTQSGSKYFSDLKDFSHVLQMVHKRIVNIQEASKRRTSRIVRPLRRSETFR